MELLVNDVTGILRAIEKGDPQAAERLWPLVYDELRRLAGAQTARQGPGQTLGATALVHEAYLRLAGGRDKAFANRRHFFAAADVGSRKAHRAATGPQAALKARRRVGPDARKWAAQVGSVLTPEWAALVRRIRVATQELADSPPCPPEASCPSRRPAPLSQPSQRQSSVADVLLSRPWLAAPASGPYHKHAPSQQQARHDRADQ